VRLQLFHPEAAGLSCEECKQWIYDIKTGKKMTRGGRSQRRQPGQATPCHECPKGSPEKAKESELSTKNWRTWDLYRRDKAIGCLTQQQRQDRILQRNFLIVDQIYQAWTQRQAAEGLAEQLAVLFGAR